MLSSWTQPPFPCYYGMELAFLLRLLHFDIVMVLPFIGALDVGLPISHVRFKCQCLMSMSLINANIPYLKKEKRNGHSACRYIS